MVCSRFLSGRWGSDMWQEYIDSVIERTSKNTDYKMTESMQRWRDQRAVKPAPVPSQWGITLPLILINTLLIIAGGPQLAIAVFAIAALLLIAIRQCP
jgi:hypothetical protein